DVVVERANGFTGAVAFDVTGAPIDVDIEVAADPATPDVVRLVIAIGDAALPGGYTLKLMATVSGIPVATLALQLQVTQRAPTSVAVRYCSGLEPRWVA